MTSTEPLLNTLSFKSMAIDCNNRIYHYAMCYWTDELERHIGYVLLRIHQQDF